MEKISCKFRNAVTTSTVKSNDDKTNADQLVKQYVAIDELHQMDLAAFKIQNVDMLVNLIAEDCIMLPPALEPLYGREAIRNYLINKFIEWKPYEIAGYDQKFDEVKINGDLAYEWGTSKGVYYMKNGGPDIFESSRVFRLLRSQPDGSWKIARIMWHDLP